MKKYRIPIVAVLCISFVIFAVVPLFGRRYIPTHDGEYHIIRIVEFSKMLSQGYLFPRWAPDMNSGFGIPIFNYHYPLPNYLGSLVRVFTRDAVYAFQMSMGLGYVALAVVLYLWLSVLFGALPALVGATVAAYVPYVFVDMYVRGSVGEIWATAFLLLALYCIEKKRLFSLAITYGLLILSHNILAMLYTPFIFIYCLIQNKKAIFWMLGGLGISAFFWLPALFESKYVMGLNIVNFREHFVQVYELLVPSWGTEFSGTGNFGNTMSVQIGIAPMIAMFGALWLSRKGKDVKKKQLFIFFMTILAVCVMFMLPISESLWNITKPLQLIQYPWRLLSFVIPISGFCTAYWVSLMRKPWWGIILAFLAVAFAASYARPALYAPRNEAYYMSRPNFTGGTSSMGNSFSTIWTGWKETRTESPVEIVNGTIFLMNTNTYLKKDFNVFMDKEGIVTINILYFPGWKVSVDSIDTPISYQKDGIIHVPVNKGSHNLKALFTDTPIRSLADAISIFSLVMIVAWGIIHIYAYRD